MASRIDKCRGNLAEVNIRRGIFQGDSLSPLLFAVCMLPLTYILRDAAHQDIILQEMDKKLTSTFYG